ncbi:hypothetical protein BH10PSE5_BH10PSE5_03240 [soil metagenome]
MRSLTLLGLGFSLMLGACTTVSPAANTSLTSLTTAPEGATKKVAVSAFMPMGAAVDAPRGYADMCRVRSPLCSERPAIEVAGRMLIGDFASSVDLSAKPSSIRNAQPEGQAFLIRASWGGAPALATGGLGAADLGERELSSFGMAALPAPAVDAPAAPKPADAAAKPLAERLKMLASVNSYVNQHVVQRTDMQNYGVEEYWTRSGVGPGATGDCEDVATEKRQQLIEQGYPVEDLFYAVAYRRDIGLHAVLVAHTETGDLVLDGRTSRIVSWDKAGYNWVKRQAQNDPSSWVMIDHPRLMASGLRVASLDPEMANRGGPGSN